MIPWAGFPETVWWHREASWQQASWHPQQHSMISRTPEKQAELPPQMAISLLLIRSTACDSQINIFIGSSEFQLDLLWMCTPPASACNHFLPFSNGFSQWFLVLRVLTPNHQGLHFPRGSYGIMQFVFREPCSPLKIYQSKRK